MVVSPQLSLEKRKFICELLPIRSELSSGATKNNVLPATTTNGACFGI